MARSAYAVDDEEEDFPVNTTPIPRLVNEERPLQDVSKHLLATVRHSSQASLCGLTVLLRSFRSWRSPCCSGSSPRSCDQRQATIEKWRVCTDCVFCVYNSLSGVLIAIFSVGSSPSSGLPLYRNAMRTCDAREASSLSPLSESVSTCHSMNPSESRARSILVLCSQRLGQLRGKSIGCRYGRGWVDLKNKAGTWASHKRRHAAHSFNRPLPPQATPTTRSTRYRIH